MAEIGWVTDEIMEERRMGALDILQEQEAAEDRSLYEDLKKIGATIDSWQSDLYVRDSEGVREALARHGYTPGKYPVGQFMSDGALWYEIPFAYSPFWEQVSRKIERAKK